MSTTLSLVTLAISSIDRNANGELRVLFTATTEKGSCEVAAMKFNDGTVKAICAGNGRKIGGAKARDAAIEKAEAAVLAMADDVGILDEASDPVGAADSSDVPEDGEVVALMNDAAAESDAADALVGSVTDDKAQAKAAAKAALTPVKLASGATVPAYMVELVKAVREHAVANYETAGWDYVVETMSDDDIVASIGRSWTAKGAIATVGKHLAPIADARSDAQAEA